MDEKQAPENTFVEWKALAEAKAALLAWDAWLDKARAVVPHTVLGAPNPSRDTLLADIAYIQEERDIVWAMLRSAKEANVQLLRDLEASKESVKNKDALNEATKARDEARKERDAQK